MLINWAALQHMRYVPPGRGPGGDVRWDDHAHMYTKMAAMEAEYTEHQVNAFPCGSQDTVLDIGCGPGRITVPMAHRAASVTAMDSSEAMLAQCRANCESAGVANVQTIAFSNERTALQILGQRDERRAFHIRRDDDAGHRFQPKPLGGAVASFAGDYLIGVGPGFT